MKTFLLTFNDGHSAEVEVAQFRKDGVGAALDHLSDCHGGVASAKPLGPEYEPRTRVVLNACFGGFGLSDAAVERLLELGMTCTERDPETRRLADPHADFERSRFTECDSYYPRRGNEPDFRTDPRLVRVVEELGAAADGECARLVVEDLPAQSWHIRDHDGKERLAPGLAYD